MDNSDDIQFSRESEELARKMSSIANAKSIFGRRVRPIKDGLARFAKVVRE